MSIAAAVPSVSVPVNRSEGQWQFAHFPSLHECQDFMDMLENQLSGQVVFHFNIENQTVCWQQL